MGGGLQSREVEVVNEKEEKRNIRWSSKETAWMREGQGPREGGVVQNREVEGEKGVLCLLAVEKGEKGKKNLKWNPLRQEAASGL